MPLFEFICNDCGAHFEELVMGEREVQCPSCGSAETSKQFSTFGFGRSSGRSSARPASVPTGGG